MSDGYDKGVQVRLYPEESPRRGLGVLVGWIDRTLMKCQKNIIFEVNQVPDDAELFDPDDMEIEHRSFVISTLQHVFTRDRMLRESDLVGIPNSAIADEISHPDHKYCFRYTWSVLQVDLNEHEWLFDLEDFIPIDTPPDNDMRCELRDLSMPTPTDKFVLPKKGLGGEDSRRQG